MFDQPRALQAPTGHQDDHKADASLLTFAGIIIVLISGSIPLITAFAATYIVASGFMVILLTVAVSGRYRQFRTFAGFLSTYFLDGDPLLTPLVKGRLLLLVVGLALAWSDLAPEGLSVLGFAAGLLCAHAQATDWLLTHERGRA